MKNNNSGGFSESTESSKPEISNSGSHNSLEGDTSKIESSINSSMERRTTNIEGDNLQKAVESFRSKENSTEVKGNIEGKNLDDITGQMKNNNKIIVENKSETENKNKNPEYDISKFMHGSDLENKMGKMRVEPQETLGKIDNEKLKARIKKDTEMTDFLPADLKKPDADPEKVKVALDEMTKNASKHYADSARAKGYLQEEMLRSVLKDNFDVSDKTEKSVHENGKFTYTDIVARNAKEDIVIGNTTIKAGETVEIESKAGDKRYLSEQIEHIANQLDGMDDKSHRFLVVTADFQQMSDNKKAELVETVKSRNAELIVMPYYACDLQTTLNYMQVSDNPEENQKNKEKQNTENNEVKSSPEKNKLTEDSDNENNEIPELENDKQKISEIINNNIELDKLNENERKALVNVGVNLAVEKMYPEATNEQIEKLKSKIAFVDSEQVQLDMGNISKEESRLIQEYYSPDGTIKLNKEATGSDVKESLIAITQESLEKLSRYYNEDNEENSGMNETLTQMYALRSVGEITGEPDEENYDDVKIMLKYESVVGEDELLNAYKTGDINQLSRDMDSILGMGAFNELYNKFNELKTLEKTGNIQDKERIREDIDMILEAYKTEKGKNNEQNN
ncbi:MAG: hypothetical protein NC177_12425 [Ruminococcus flavefaciens]|nr:hypothetical protein [Ruminococcus flavefaciens]